VSCPRRDLLGATAIPAVVLDITRAPLALPSRASDPASPIVVPYQRPRAGVGTCWPESAPEQVSKHHGLADLAAAWSRSGASRFGPWPAPIGAATPSPARVLKLGTIAPAELLEALWWWSYHLRSAVDGATCLRHSPSSALLSVSPADQFQGRKEGHIQELNAKRALATNGQRLVTPVDGGAWGRIVVADTCRSPPVLERSRGRRRLVLIGGSRCCKCSWRMCQSSSLRLRNSRPQVTHFSVMGDLRFVVAPGLQVLGDRPSRDRCWAACLSALVLWRKRAGGGCRGRSASRPWPPAGPGHPDGRGWPGDRAAGRPGATTGQRGRRAGRPAGHPDSGSSQGG
jgi:hypothetical protein